MNKSFPNTAPLIERARLTDAALFARAGVLANGFSGDQHAYPVFSDRAQGSYVWDIDGNRYIDLILGFGCVVLGHNDESVTEAVIRALQAGICPTLACNEQLQLSERLASTIPNAEMSYFLKTGSDATSLAVRLARAVTGRSTVLRWGYHGWHDWCAPRAAGTVPAHRAKTRGFQYNSLESLRQGFHAASGDVACVMMMPFEIDLPEPGFLEGIREMCDRNGALLVFDEVRSGFRIALGGAQEHFGVEADLVCLSKAIANGHALSALCGRADHMRRLAEVSASSTFFRGRDGFVAALATIDRLEAAFATGEVERISKAVSLALKTAIQRSGAPFSVVGHPTMPFLRWDGIDAEREAAALQRFCARMIAEGILLHPAHHWFVSLALSDADIAAIGTAATRALSGMVLDGDFAARR